MKQSRVNRRVENFVQVMKRDGISGLIVLGDEVGYFVRNFGKPEMHLLLVSSLLHSFREQAPEHWDEIKAAILDVVEIMNRDEEKMK